MYVSINDVDLTKYVQRDSYLVYSENQIIDEWQSASGKYHENTLRQRVVGTIKFAFYEENAYSNFLALLNANVSNHVLPMKVFVMDKNEIRNINVYYTFTPEKHLDYNLNSGAVIDFVTLSIRER